MRHKLLSEAHGLRSFALVFEIGEEVVAGLEAFARENDLSGSQLTAIGAFRRATLAYWHWDSKEYEEIPVEEQVEVVSLTGNIARAPDGEGRKVHVHCVLGRRDGSAMAGHLLEAEVRPTLELMLAEQPEHLQRREDEETGLPLLEP